MSEEGNVYKGQAMNILESLGAAYRFRLRIAGTGPVA